MRGISFCAAVGMLAISGCAGKDAKVDSSKVVQSGATSAPANAKFDPATHTAMVHAKDFAFDAPDTIPAGWTNFHLVNDGPALHHVQLVRLDSGKTVTDLTKAMSAPGEPPHWAVFVGGPNAPDPHGESDAALNLTAGNYVMLCLVDLGDHVPHFAKGMVHPLTVAATSAPAPEPTADATVDLSDYSFALPATLAAGKHTFKIVNKGPQVHEIEIIRLAPGKTGKDMMAWMDKMQGPPPGSAIGGVSGMIPSATAYVTSSLDAGNYLILCFVPDSKDGKPHFAHGMMKEIKIG